MQEPASPTPDNARAARLRAALERELRADEAVLWHGWQLGRIEARMFLTYIFAIPWTAFSVMWTGLAAAAIAGSGEDGPGWIGWAFPLFGLPFVAIGLGMLAGPFVPWFQQGRVLYVVTGERVLKLSLGRALEVTAVPADRIGLATRSEQRDGTGSLTLAIKIGRDSDGDRQTEHFAIGAVADVIGAHQAINRIAAPGRNPAAPLAAAT
jgi:hypothetical protein